MRRWVYISNGSLPIIPVIIGVMSIALVLVNVICASNFTFDREGDGQ